MAYTNKVNSEKYNSPFPTRLRHLIDQKGCTQKALAEHLGITSQAIGAYCRGETKPTLESAQAIADYFSVSLDYLSGHTDISSRDDNLHISHNTTGISESAIECLQDWRNAHPEYIDTLNSLIISYHFEEFLSHVYHYGLVANAANSNEYQTIRQIVQTNQQEAMSYLAANSSTPLVTAFVALKSNLDHKAIANFYLNEARDSISYAVLHLADKNK